MIEKIILIHCCRLSCLLSPTMRLPWLISITRTKIGNVKSGRLLAGANWIRYGNKAYFERINPLWSKWYSTYHYFRWDGTSPFCAGKCSGWDFTNHYHHLKSIETIRRRSQIYYNIYFITTIGEKVRYVAMFHLWRDELEVREHTSGDGKQCWTGATIFCSRLGRSYLFSCSFFLFRSKSWLRRLLR